MDKNILISFILIAAVIFLFNGFIIPAFFPNYHTKATAPSVEQPTPALQEKAKPETVEDTAVVPPSPLPPAPEALYTLENTVFSMSLSSCGGAIKEVVMKQFKEQDGAPLVLFSLKNPKTYALNIPRVGSYQLINEQYQWQQTPEGVVFTLSSDKGFAITKTLVLDPASPVLLLKLAIRNNTAQALSLNDGYDIFCGELPQLKKEKQADVLGVAGLLPNGNIQRFQPMKVKESEQKVFVDSFRWAAVQNKYFAIILKSKEYNPAIGYFSKEAETGERSVAAFLRKDTITIPAQGIYEEEYTVYIGPKSTQLLEKADPTFKDIFDFGFFSFFCKIILWSLQWIYKMCGNYGVAIIILTLILKIIMTPLTHKSMQSMKKMHQIQPLITALKEECKNDTKKLHAETMKLYKQYGINPMGGCIPMLLQIPIFIALFNTLRSAVELWGARFLWIQDLSLPDTIGRIAGLPINVLVLLMGATMYIQQKQTTVDPTQQKMMVMMPVVFTVMFYSFPSGLVLYWLVNNVLSILHQEWFNRFHASPPLVPVVKPSAK